MYAMHRPSLVLHTNEFVKQTNDLNLEDWKAAWSVVSALENGVEGGNVMVIYNCGVDAGSSQGHKHLQIFPLLQSKEFHCWPEDVDLSGEWKIIVTFGI
jgi:ATP adenylyltransferase